MNSAQNDGFFATQIAQKGVEDPDQPHLNESPKQKEKSPTKDDPTSLKNLLVVFNSFDKKQKGMIPVQQAKQILQLKSIAIDKFDVHYKISMPAQNGFVTFDEFLFIFALCEDTSLDVDHKYEISKKVDKRLVEFLRLLNNYRKKSQSQGNYNQAKKSKSKIEEIRQRELQRKKNYLNILHQHEISQLQQKQRVHFEDFCQTWDKFMMDYEKTAAQLIEKLQQKHENQLKQYEIKIREELGSKIRFSKQIIQLQARQKTLVKLQEYEKAGTIKKQIEQLKMQEMQKKQRTDQDSIDIRCATLRKQQLSAVNSLLQNIQKDRNDQLKQRKQDSQKLIIRNKSLISEINHKHAEAIKKIFEALHNLSIDSEKPKTAKRNAY